MYNVYFTDVVKTVSYISKSVELNQPRLLKRAIRQHGLVRRTVGVTVLRAVVDRFIPTAYAHRTHLLEALSILPSDAAPTTAGGDAMDISDPAVPAATASTITPPTTLLPEVEIFLLTLVLTTLLRYHCDEDAAQFASMVVGRVRSLNRRSLDILSSKVFFYFSLAYEKINKLENIRSTLLALYRTACLHHDDIGQAVLLNLLLPVPISCDRVRMHRIDMTIVVHQHATNVHPWVKGNRLHDLQSSRIRL